MRGYDRIASLLLNTARLIVPVERRDWADAMHIELRHVSQGERLRWALGCLWTALRMKFGSMRKDGFRVARGVMLVEAIGAFGPLTLGWYEVVWGDSGIVRLSGEIIDKYFLAYPGGQYILVMMFVNGVVGLLGPVGLFFGLRYVLTGQGVAGRSFGHSMFFVLVIVNLLGTIAGLLWGPADFYVPLEFTFLFAWLPAAVLLHLTWLGRPQRGSAPPRIATF